MKIQDILVLKRGYDLPESKRIKGKYLVYSSNGISGCHNEYKIKGPAVITGRSGSLGNVQYTQNNCWPLNTTLYVSDFKGNNPKYISYLLQTLHLEKYGSGSAVPTLNRNHLDNLEVPFHSLTEQQHIVDTVGSLDDKIENNNKIIIKLEELLNLKFKNIYNDALKTGIIINLNDIVNLKTGKKDANAANENGIYPFFTCSEKESNIDLYSFNQEAILIAGNGNMSVKYFNGKFDAYQRTYVISSSKYFYYLYLYYKNFIGNISVGAKGSVIKFLTKSMLLDIDLPILDNITMQRFESDIQKILNYELRLSEENKKLNLLKEKYLKRFF